MAERIGGGAPPTHHPQSSAGAPLQPTFHGFIASTMDALVLFEACLTGHMAHVPRRPHDRERTQLIRSGHVFIYEEHSSGIKRWTDGVPWSPSRILGNFLLYRELDKPFQPGEKKRAMKKTKQENGVTKPQSNSRSNSVGFNGMGPLPVPQPYGDGSAGHKDIERALVGSLVDSYQFKPEGLVKKTISVQYRGMQHHLVSYYNIDDVIHKRLRTPLDTPELNHITPRPQLISAGNFRAPVDDHELVMDDRSRLMIAQGVTTEMPGYGQARSLSVPSVTPYGAWPTSTYQQSTHYHPMSSHSLAPPVTYAPTAPPGYAPYDQNNIPRMVSHYPNVAMSQAGRRHSTVPGATGYESTMNGGGHGAYGSISSMDRNQMNGTPVLPSSSVLGSQHMSHTSYSNSSLYEPPTGTAGSSQHGSMYDNGPRHSTGYESSAPPHQNGGYDAQTASIFDTTGNGQPAGEYETSMATQQAMPNFDSGSDDNASAALGAMDLNQPVGSTELSDGGHYSSFPPHQSDFTPRGSHSQSTLGP